MNVFLPFHNAQYLSLCADLQGRAVSASSVAGMPDELGHVPADGPAMSGVEARLSEMLRLFHYVRDIICFVIVQKHNPLRFSCYSQRLEIRAQVADAFLSKFQLTSDEMGLLRGTRGGPVTEVRVLAVYSVAITNATEKMRF